MLLQMCPYEVPRTIDDGDYLSFIHSRDGVMPQDIHLDSFAPGWSFLTAQEHDQELLILWNCFKLVRLINSLSGDRTAVYLNILKTLNFDCKKPHISNHRYIIVFIRYIQIPPLLHLPKL